MSNFYFIVSVIVFILTLNFANSLNYNNQDFAKLRNEAAKCTHKSLTYKDAIGCNKCSCIGKKMLQCTVKKCPGGASDVVIPSTDDDSNTNSGKHLVIKTKEDTKAKYNKLAISAKYCKPGATFELKPMCANCKCLHMGVIRCKRILNCVKKDMGFHVNIPNVED